MFSGESGYDRQLLRTRVAKDHPKLDARRSRLPVTKRGAPGEPADKTGLGSPIRTAEKPEVTEERASEIIADLRQPVRPSAGAAL
jgi:hypothetical protein